MTTPAPTTHDLGRRSPATRLLHRDLGHHDERGFCPFPEPSTYAAWLGSNLSSSCSEGHHEQCPGQAILTSYAAPWRCRCLCHHARVLGR